MLNRHRDISTTVPDLDLEQITVVGALGRGAKGVVFLVRNGLSGEFLALKVILKELIEKKNNKGSNDRGDVKLDPATDTVPPGVEYRRILFEQDVLARFQHPLLPRLRGVLSTGRVLGYAIDYCAGRDLGTLRRKQTEKMFSDDVIRFYAAELVLALEYMHSLGIVYRDLKPDNVMVQESGHIMLVDFDLSTKLLPRSSADSNPPPLSPPFLHPPKHKHTRKKRFSTFRSFCNSGISPLTPSPPKQERQYLLNSNLAADSDSGKSNSFVGTEEYVAPEIILGNGHDFAVDWWSLGIVLYEMLYGRTPFRGTNRQDTFSRILSKSPDLVGETTSLRGLIRNLLAKDPTQRIELEGIKGHDFFRDLDWEGLTEMVRPPYIPNGTVTENVDGVQKVDVELFVQGIFGRESVDTKLDDDVTVEMQRTDLSTLQKILVDRFSDCFYRGSYADFLKTLYDPYGRSLPIYNDNVIEL